MVDILYISVKYNDAVSFLRMEHRHLGYKNMKPHVAERNTMTRQNPIKPSIYISIGPYSFTRNKFRDTNENNLLLDV
jgi:hypothetical protein